MESSKLKRHQLVHTGEKPFQVSDFSSNLTNVRQDLLISRVTQIASMLGTF